MTDRRPIEAQLSAAAQDLHWPQTPDLSAAVIDRISAGAARRRAPRRTRWSVAAAVAAAIVVFVAAVPAAREAVASWLGIGAVQVETVPQLDLDELSSAFLLGTPTDLGAARERVEFDVAPPTRLGAPDGVFVDDAGRVWLAYQPRADLPEIGTSGLGALVAFLPGDMGPTLFKQVDPTADIEFVTVDGADALWIEGGPHAVFVVDSAGVVVEESGRLAGNTLVWSPGRATIRIESALGLEGSIEIARSMP